MSKEKLRTLRNPITYDHIKVWLLGSWLETFTYSALVFKNCKLSLQQCYSKEEAQNQLSSLQTTNFMQIQTLLQYLCLITRWWRDNGSLNKTTHKWQQWQFKHGMQIQVSGVTHDVWLHNTLHAQCPLFYFIFNDWSLLYSEQSVLMLPIVLWQIRLILPSVMYYVLLCVVVNKLTLCIYILVVCRHGDIIQ